MRNLVLVLTMVASSLAVAQPSRPPDSKIASPRQAGDRPAYEMEQALAMARRYAADHKVTFGKAYLQGAVFDLVKRDWVFDWMTPNAKGGVTVITVHETGEISINYGE